MAKNKNKDRYSNLGVVNGNKVSVKSSRTVAQVEQAISRLTKDRKGIRWDFSALGNDVQALVKAKGISI